jgi:4-hydroxybenzoate polyprenyltransferase
MKYPKLLAYAQLLRLPNVFTAFADICLGAAATGLIADAPGAFAFALAASGCLYCAGMVLNDYFDRFDDAKTRPYRPIPSGRVSPRIALLIGGILIIAGAYFAVFANNAQDTTGYPNATMSPPLAAGLLIVAILLYNAYLKRTPLGPLGMGACRFLNVLLGVSVTWPRPIPDELMWHLAAVVGVYIVGVTWFARTEEAASNRRQLMLAAGVMLLAVLGGLLVPVHFAPGTAHPDPAPWYFPYFVAGFIFYVGTPVVRAIRRPEPKPVQAAVKRSILGLVVLDAVLATAFVGWPGLLILLLLPPALWLGKWVYST